MAKTKTGLLWVFLFQFGGAFIGAVIAIAILQGSPENNSPLRQIEMKISSLTTDIQDASKSYDKAFDHMKNSLARIEGQIFTRNAIPPGGSSSPNIEYDDGSLGSKDQWISVLPVEITRPLGEHDLSPFDDPEVASIVWEANQAFLAVKNESLHGKSMAFDLFKSGQIKVEEYNAALSENAVKEDLQFNLAMDRYLAQLEKYLKEDQDM